jgi:hypothetical protein
MIKITKKLKKNKFKPREYAIYTKEEADSASIVYKDWRRCTPGEYGLSDDDYVSECLYRKNYKYNTEITYPFGRQWLGKDGKNRCLEFEPHYRSRNFSTVSTKPLGDIEARSKRAELAVNAFIMYKMAGEQPNWDTIGSLYRPEQKNPGLSAKRLFKLKQVKKMIEDKLKDILINKDIDEGFVLDVIKDAIDVARVKEDSGNMIRAAKELSEFLDMKPKTKQFTETLEVDISHQIADSYEKQTKKLKATQTKELDEKNSKDIGK